MIKRRKKVLNSYRKRLAVWTANDNGIVTTLWGFSNKTLNELYKAGYLKNKKTRRVSGKTEYAYEISRKGKEWVERIKRIERQMSR